MDVERRFVYKKLIDYTIYEVEGPENISIAHLTDLHDRDYIKILDITRKSNPDIICVCGDFLLNELVPEQSVGICDLCDFISTQKNALSSKPFWYRLTGVRTFSWTKKP